MKKNVLSLIPIIFTLFLLAGCGDKETDLTAYKGPIYPATTSLQYIFQAGQAAPSCRVFAELLVSLPAEVSGEIMRQKLEGEAQSHGADMVLIGQSRQMEDDEGFTFVYYGPQKEYLCNEKWCGWKYGYDTWEEQGDFVNIGFQEWGNKNVQFDYPVMLQAVFLRCQ